MQIHIDSGRPLGYQLRIIVFSIILLLMGADIGAAPIYRPGQARRTLNTDHYVVTIQKNNRVDVQGIDGQPIVDNAYPEVTLAGKKARPLKLHHRESTRIAVRDGLGQGNGILFKSPECEWRISTYPGQPYISVQATFFNSTKKPVELVKLSPWSIDQGKGGVFLSKDQNVAEPGGVGVGPAAAFSPSKGEALIAGFVTKGSGTSEVRVAQTEGSPFLNVEAISTFEPPLRLEPGERYVGDVLYLAVRERDLVSGLRRYVSAVKRMSPYPTLPRAYRHGWYAGANSRLDEATLREQMETLAQVGAPSGWSHVDLGTAWMNSPDTLAVAQDRFPGGLAGIAGYAHGFDLTLGLSIPLKGFTASALAGFISSCDTAGIDSIELAYAEAAPGEAVPTIHPRLLQEALDESAYAGRKPVFVQSMPLKPSLVPDWARASHQFYRPTSGNPFLIHEDGAPVLSGSEFTDRQFVTVCSSAAMRGTNLRTATPYSAQSTLRRQVLDQLAPVYTSNARPIDLTGAAPPRQWYLPLKAKAGAWTILGLFNWDAGSAATIRTPLGAFELNPGVTYTVYDFWAGRYLGRIKDRLQVEVPPEGVRLLGLRYDEQRPMLVASNRHFTQGAFDHGNVTWSHEAQELSGSFEATAGFPYTLTFYIPEAYRLKQVDSSEVLAGQELEGDALRVSLTPDSMGEVTWSLQF
jgi:hypothetical protein